MKSTKTITLDQRVAQLRANRAAGVQPETNSNGIMGWLITNEDKARRSMSNAADMRAALAAERKADGYRF